MRNRLFCFVLVAGGFSLIPEINLSAQQAPTELKQAVKASVDQYVNAEYYSAVASVSELIGDIDSTKVDFQRTVTIDYWKDKSLLVRDGENSIIAFSDQIVMTNQSSREFKAVDLDIPSISSLSDHDDAVIYSVIHSLPVLQFLRNKSKELLGESASWQQVGPNLMEITIQGETDSILVLNTRTNMLEKSYIDMGMDEPSWIKVEYQNQFLYNSFDKNNSPLMDTVGDDFSYADISKIQSLDELIGTKFPDFSITSVSGETMTAEDLNTGNALVHLWDYTLSDSKKSFHDIEELNEDEGDDWTIWSIAFSTDQEKAEENSKKLLEMSEGEFPCFLLDHKSPFMRKVAAKGFPTVIIFEDGVIKDIQTGYWENYEEDLESLYFDD